MNTKDLLRVIPAVMLLASIAGTLYHSQWWLALTGFVGLNLFQSAFTKWCLLEDILLAAGVKEASPLRETRAARRASKTAVAS